jgi:hypothetical protein
MNKSVLPCITVALFAFPLPSRADDPADAERLAQRLIQQLGSKSFREREAASKRLKEIGEPAWKALRRTEAESKDAEVRARAAILLRGVKDPEEDARTFDAIVAYWRQHIPVGSQMAHISDMNDKASWVVVPSGAENLYQHAFAPDFVQKRVQDRDPLRRDIAQSLLELKLPVRCSLLFNLTAPDSNRAFGVWLIRFEAKNKQSGSR